MDAIAAKYSAALRAGKASVGFGASKASAGFTAPKARRVLHPRHRRGAENYYGCFDFVLLGGAFDGAAGAPGGRTGNVFDVAESPAGMV